MRKKEKPKPVDVDGAREKLIEHIPEALEAIYNCMLHPSRHAQAQLAAAKTWLDRAGLPAVAATTISAPDGGPVKHVGRFVIELVEMPKPSDDSGGKR